MAVRFTWVRHPVIVSSAALDKQISKQSYYKDTTTGKTVGYVYPLADAWTGIVAIPGGLRGIGGYYSHEKDARRNVKVMVE